jgi:streptomycin 6-kinase
MQVWSTPRGADNHAKHIRHFISWPGNSRNSVRRTREHFGLAARCLLRQDDHVGPMVLPRNPVDPAGREGWSAWLTTTLPQVIEQAQELWSLTVGEPFQPGGQTGWVAPAHDGSGADLVLKVAWPHPEATHEADGLRAWAGNGAVLLRAAKVFESAVALLLERCVPGFPLSRRPEPEQDVTIAGLLHRLWITPAEAHPFQPLQVMCQQWADTFERKAGTSVAALDRGLAPAGIALFRELPATAADQV